MVGMQDANGESKHLALLLLKDFIVTDCQQMRNNCTVWILVPVPTTQVTHAVGSRRS